MSDGGHIERPKGGFTQPELDLIRWVLPADRPGYRLVLDKLESWSVLAQGRRGDGHWVLGEKGAVPDHESPLSHVFATGTVLYESGARQVTVREPSDRTADVEFAGETKGVETGRWTLSTWLPDLPCPECGKAVRQIPAATESGGRVVLVICSGGRKMWVHDASRLVNLPVPVTLFYTELMRQLGTKDPAVAFSATRLFEATDSFRDRDLVLAFARYNDIRSKVGVEDRIVLPRRTKGFISHVRSLFAGKQ